MAYHNGTAKGDCLGDCLGYRQRQAVDSVGRACALGYRLGLPAGIDSLAALSTIVNNHRVLLRITAGDPYGGNRQRRIGESPLAVADQFLNSG